MFDNFLFIVLFIVIPGSLLWIATQREEKREREKTDKSLEEAKRINKAKEEAEAARKAIENLNEKLRKGSRKELTLEERLRKSEEHMERSIKETKDSIELLISEFEDMGISQTLIKNIKKLSYGGQERLLHPMNFQLDVLVSKITELDVEELSLILEKETKPWKYVDHPIHMSDYLKDEYLKSDDWYNLKLKRLKLANHKCESSDCFNTKNLELHHQNYYDLGNEDIDDVRIVCRQCHQTIHDKHGYNREGHYPI